MLESSDEDRPPPGSGPSVLVLGGTGFVGRHICRAFAAAGWRVTAVARRDPGPGPWHRRLAVDVDATTAEEFGRLVSAAGASAVVNAAGAVWDTTEEQMERANVRLVENVVAGLAALPRRVRLVHLGSVHEYGPARPGEDIHELSPLRPVNAYGRTKLLGTRHVLEAADRGRIDALALRIANVSGPGAPRGSLLGLVADRLTGPADGPAPAELRLAPLLSRRDFVDVRDVAEAVLAAATAGTTARVINIGRGEAVGVRSLVERLIELSGRPVRLVEEAAATGRGPDAEWQRLDIGAARELLGWAPTRDLDRSLRDLMLAAQH
ncbi:NAD-dependent epimerase/dehydratase family protein [Kitasatospora sp. NPDC088134]|uniref:NAD-dependent epimerase/dehydratase family protein n=1 Tax=Kitasatospora sp. NPDC088134 TaxID=3364071 RepID=UPI0037F2451C